MIYIYIHWITSRYLRRFVKHNGTSSICIVGSFQRPAMVNSHEIPSESLHPQPNVPQQKLDHWPAGWGPIVS